MAADFDINSTFFEQKEQIIHGDFLFPVTSYHTTVPDSFTELALHWHDEMEVTLIHDGCAMYRIYSDIFETHDGDILLIPPHCLHAAHEIPGKTMISDSLVFHLSYLGAADQDIASFKYISPLARGSLSIPHIIHACDRGYDALRRTFEKALACLNTREAFYELKFREYMTHFMILLFENGYVAEDEHSRHEEEQRQALVRILNYVNQNLTKKLTVAEAALFVGFSESHFTYYFKKNVGMSFISYVNHCRLQKAAQSLRDTSRPITDIALDNGFDNISYFNRQFKALFKMTPGRFRALYH